MIDKSKDKREVSIDDVIFNTTSTIARFTLDDVVDVSPTNNTENTGDSKPTGVIGETELTTDLRGQILSNFSLEENLGLKLTNSNAIDLENVPSPREYIEGIEKAHQELLENGKIEPRIKLGIPHLERKLEGGLKRGELTVIGAFNNPERKVSFDLPIIHQRNKAATMGETESRNPNPDSMQAAGYKVSEYPISDLEAIRRQNAEKIKAFTEERNKAFAPIFDAAKARRHLYKDLIARLNDEIKNGPLGDTVYVTSVTSVGGRLQFDLQVKMTKLRDGTERPSFKALNRAKAFKIYFILLKRKYMREIKEAEEKVMERE